MTASAIVSNMFIRALLRGLVTTLNVLSACMLLPAVCYIFALPMQLLQPSWWL